MWPSWNVHRHVPWFQWILGLFGGPGCVDNHFKETDFKTTYLFCWLFSGHWNQNFWGIGRMSSCLMPKI